MKMRIGKKKYLLRTLLVGFGFTLVFGSVFALIPKSNNNIPALIAVLGVYVSVAISLLFRLIEISHNIANEGDFSALVSQDNDWRTIMEKLRDSLEYTGTKKDPFFTDMYQALIRDFSNRLGNAASGCIKFPPGERWRKYWKKIISQRDLGEYRSTSWVKSPEYWRDPAGREGFEFNKTIEAKTTRVFIIRDKYWDHPDVWEMIRDQYDAKNIEIRVVRETILEENDPDLLLDFGIYGERAVGYQELDDNCRTKSFTFHFDEKKISDTEDIFEGLLVYATESVTKDFLSRKEFDKTEIKRKG